MNKKRELEQQVTDLQAQVQGLNKQLEGYRAQESAIVRALTDAQTSAGKRVLEGEVQAKKIVDEANAQRARAEAEADALIQEATEKAAEIVEAAQAESSRRLAQAEASVQDFETRLNALNATLLDTARQAKEQAEAFARSMEALTGDTPEILQEGRGLSALIQSQAGKLPDSYGTPQELMHGIYRLQGRDIPAVPETEPDAEPTEPAFPGESVPAQEEQPVREEQTAAEEPEERVWTVEEVMAKSGAYPSMDKNGEDEDVDLDSLLDEIIRE
ncbi:MAG TPA: hypothetical protein VN366_13655 [Feifaniaceae bacterium]|nr:hypothetical protein [Feifaniaceae bacterium]